MDNAEALPALESRIATLVAQYAGIPDGMTVPRACSSVMDAVAAQGVTSSEGGKRLRARLALAAFDAARPETAATTDAGDAGDAARAAVTDLSCAIEVFQTAALVHDDIIDDSDLRRGKPSAHRALAAALGDDPQADHVGRGLGIMLGDLLATASVAIAHDAAAALPKTEALVRVFLRMHREVEIGQVLDLAVEETPLDRPDALASASLGVFRWKTASYTTIAPIELGLLAAGTKTVKAHAIADSIGMPLGLAFQLADDLIDVIGSSASTGKPVGGDIREGKRTVLLADALAGANEAERSELIRMFEAPERTADDVSRAIDLFGSTGAIDRSRERITALWRTSAAAADEAASMLGLPADRRALLLGACERFLPATLRTR